MMLKNMLLFICAGLFIIGCIQADSGQSEAMLQEDLQCPGKSNGEFARWGGMDRPGWAHSCKMSHGKYHVWQGEILTIEGQFSFGKRVGEWIIRDNIGAVTKIVTYEDGKEVSERRETE